MVDYRRDSSGPSLNHIIWRGNYVKRAPIAKEDMLIVVLMIASCIYIASLKSLEYIQITFNNRISSNFDTN